MTYCHQHKSFQIKAMLQEFNILLLYPGATSQHLLHITYTHFNNDSAPKKVAVSFIQVTSQSVIAVATTAKHFSMKNMARTPNTGFAYN